MDHMKKKKLDQAPEKISKLALVLEIGTHIYLTVKSQYPWSIVLPKTWTLVVMFLEGYSPLFN